MIYKFQRRICVLCLVATIVSAVFSPAPAFCESLRFVFMADSRGGSLDEPVNTPVLNAIISQIKALSPQPAFVVFGGDMSYRGCIHGSYTFQNWKDIFAPLTTAGIPLYTAIGNHELYAHGCGQSNEGFFLVNQQQYQNVFTENPSNGPPGYERLVYSFTSPKGDAFFAVLDPYYLTADNPNPSLCGTIDATQFAWLETQVAQTQAAHKFLFIHAPYYYVTGANPADPSESSCIPDATFTNLWAFLDNNQFDIYACGHQHLYSRKTIDSSILPNPQTSPNPTPPWQNNVVQLLNGTCGAGVDTSTPTVNPALWHVSQAANTYYFSVVDINDSQVTIASYSGDTGVYNIFDTDIAAVLANGRSQSIDITEKTPLSVTVALDPGSLSGQNADWWVVASTPWGIYSLTPSGWTPGINILAQYPLFKIGPAEVFNGYLPAGDYTFYLGVDMNPDGILDEPLYFDGVQVHASSTTEHDNGVF
jgi:hypothetical protein